MRTRALFLTLVASLCVAGCEESAVHIDENCSIGEKSCNGGVLYRCDPSQNETSNFWNPVAICVMGLNGCDEGGKTCINKPNCFLGNDEDGSCVQAQGCAIGHKTDGSCANCALGNDIEKGSCIQAEECALGNNEDGSCIQAEGCTLGNEADGSCVKAQNCLIGNEEDGSCMPKDGCVVGHEADGSCTLKAGCAEGNNEDGSCKGCAVGTTDDGSCMMREGCTIGNVLDGSCIYVPDCPAGNKVDGSCNGCVAGNAADGACKRLEGCPDGNRIDGSCKGCAIGNGEDGSCRKREDCIDGNELDGSCVLIDGCPNNEHNDDGSCKGCVIKEDNKTNNKDGTCIMDKNCKNGNELDGSCLCDCKFGCYSDGSCVEIECMRNDDCSEKCDQGLCHCFNHKCEIDANHNNMYDMKEHINNPNWNHDCEYSDKYSDIKFKCPADDESCKEFDVRDFCDSFTDKKWATKCESDNDCIQQENDYGYHFVCRSDGRCVADAFVTQWFMANQSIKEDPPSNTIRTFVFPYYPSEDECVIHIIWGDESKTCHTDQTDCSSSESDCSIYNCKGEEFNCSRNNPKITHEYKKPNVYIIKVTGEFDFARVTVNNDSIVYLDGDNNNACIYPFGSNSYSNRCLKRIISFGSVRLKPHAFRMYEALNPISTVDIPILSGDKFDGDLSYLFTNTSIADANTLNKWDVHNVIKMDNMLSHTNFNGPLNNWDVSNVDNMNNLFSGTSSFNQPLNNWDVSKVQTMTSMFNNAHFFNQPLNNWNVSEVTQMNYMFTGAINFNQPLDKWNVSKVKKFGGMFYSAYKFDQNLEDWQVSEDAELDYNTYKMFGESGMSKENSCKIYNSTSWQVKPKMDYTCAP